MIAPGKVFVEEGTSLHYDASVDASYPDAELLQMVTSQLNVNTAPIVSSDAVYRQTFRKEQLWRDQGAVGVDMETSAVFTVSRYVGVKAVALLMVSDGHPVHENSPKWEWSMTRDMRYQLAERGITVAKQLNRA